MDMPGIASLSFILAKKEKKKQRKTNMFHTTWLNIYLDYAVVVKLESHYYIKYVTVV